MEDLARLEDDVAQLLQQIPTAGSNAAQVELLQRAQEVALHRDPSSEHRLLRVARPFLQTLLHQQNAPLVAAILQFLHEAARRSALFFGDLFEAVATVLLLSFSSEKNVLKALDLATSTQLDAFQFVVAAAAPPDLLSETWQRVCATLEHVGDLVSSTPLLLAPSAATSDNNNRSVMVFLRAWKLLERAVLMLTEAKEATVYRDPARSNVQPDAVSVDLVPITGHAVLQRKSLIAFGDALLRRQIDRILSPAAGVAQLTRRELCIAINSLSLIAAVRPQLIPVVIPALIACHTPSSSGKADRAVQSTLKANLVKLLSHPAAQELAEEVTECVIALNDGERAFRAISKSKDPRRKYVSAPSEASLRRARIGKRTAEQISESFEQQDRAKRGRASQTNAVSQASTQERITAEALVNMPSSAVLNLVLGGFGADLPPPPTNLVLLLPPSELKSRMTALLAKLATPSSVLALETSIRRSRDPRRRRDSQDSHQQPSLLAVFDDETIEETSDWVSKNSTTVEEPLVSLAEDGSVQVFLKPVSAIWCRDMASAALARILENEYGASIRGDDSLRETLVCRLASSPWFLLTDERNATIHPSNDDARLPAVYQIVLDFVMENVERRVSLANALLHHEYVRVTSEIVGEASEFGPPKTGDVVYRKAVDYFLQALVRALDLSSSSDRKLFGKVVTSLPRVTVEVFRVLVLLFGDPHKNAGGAVLGITVLRDLVRERKSCEKAALQMLLRYTCESDDASRSKPIQCVANQLYVIEALKEPIEQYALRLVSSLEGSSPSSGEVSGEESGGTEISSADLEGQTNGDDDAHTQDTGEDTAVFSQRSAWLRERLAEIEEQDRLHITELQDFARNLDESGTNLESPLDNEVEVLRRLELYVALCAKKPALLGRLVAAYGHASEIVRQVIFQAIEKLIKHLKQRSSGSIQVITQLHGFEAPSLGLVCHIIQILSARSSSSKSGADEAAANAELVNQVLKLWQTHAHIPDAISVLIPIISSIPKVTMEPLLPTLLALPQNRWSVAMTRVFEAMPPQVFTPIDLLISLHHIDLKQDPGMQKKVILGINFCLEHRHAFPAEVLLHVCRVLLQEEHISKLALRTLILSVTAFPTLQHDAAQLLRGLVDRRVWEMQEEGDALWKGFVKCAVLVQPASFPVLLDTHKFPIAQLENVLRDEPELRGLLREYVESPDASTDNVRIHDDVRALLAAQLVPSESMKEVKVEGDAVDGHGVASGVVASGSNEE